MSKPNILVTGATGNVGRALLPMLKNAEANLFAGSTHGHDQLGVRGISIDFNNCDALQKVFAGIELAFIVIPLNPSMVEMARNITKVAKVSGIKHFVRISGAGADPNSPFAVARVQGQVDQILSESGVSTTFLRPKNFMSNFKTFMAGMIKSGTVYSSQGEGRIPFIHVDDIAAVAAAVLNNPARHVGQSYVLSGPRAMTNREALDVIGKAVERHINLVSISEEAAQKSMRDMGMPEMVIDVMSSLNQVIAAGYVAELTDTVRQITGRPPKTFEEFAQENIDAWK